MMDADRALELINDELLRNGHPPVVMGEDQKRLAFASLQQYAHFTQRPIEIAVQDVARFQIQSLELAALRSQS